MKNIDITMHQVNNADLCHLKRVVFGQKRALSARSGKKMQFRKTLAAIAVIFAMDSICAVYGANVDQDLATPKSTVLAYCKSGVFYLGSKYFHFPKERVANSNSSPLNWQACKVITIKKTHLIGAVVDGGQVKNGDVEVVLQVLEPNSKGMKDTNRYWFLLRDFDGNWKIISYSIVSNDAT